MKDFASIAEHLHDGMGTFAAGEPDVADAFKSLMGASTRDGTLDNKTKELIALAIGITVRCDGCIAHHSQAVCDAGASRDEVLETIGVSIMMGGGPSMVYGVEALEAFDQFAAERSA